MYDWLDDIWQLAGSTAAPEALRLAPAVATGAQLAEVEQALGIPLPPSYAAFLRRWNGATLQGSRILSTDELLGDPVIFEDWADEAGDEAAEQLFEAVSDWEQRLQAMLEERGAGLSEPIPPDWTNWQ